MAKPRAMRKKDEDRSALVEALNFVSVAQKKTGSPYQTHVIMSMGWLIAFDGVLTAATKINEQIEACPHSDSFNAALSKVGTSFTLIQSDENSIAVKGEINSREFGATIPCMPREVMHLLPPDPLLPGVAIGDALKGALASVAFLVTDDPHRPAMGAVCVRPGSCLATDGRVMLEAWHGFELPVMLLPKATAEALAAIKKPLVGIGYSQGEVALNSATFYFDDGSWLKSQMKEGSPINFDQILNVDTNMYPIPSGLFEALKIIAPFNENGEVIFDSNSMRSHPEKNKGATLEIAGLPPGLCFNAKYLLAIQSFATQIDLVGRNNIAYFIGDNVRGAVVSRPAPAARDPEIDRRIKETQEALKSKPWAPPLPGKYDDEIPF